MLKGFYRFGGNKLNLMGYDLGNSVTLYGWVEKLRDHDFFDKGFSDGVPSDWKPRFGMTKGSLYLSIGLSNMTIEEPTQGEEKTELNIEAFDLLGSIIRGCKILCVPKNRVDFYDIGSETEFNENKEVHYTFNNAEVILKNGNIVCLEYNDGETKVYLKWDEGTPPTHLGYKPDNHKLIKLSKINEVAETGVIEEDIYSVPTGDFYSLEEIIKRNPNKSYDWLQERSYQIVKKEDLKELRDYLLEDRWKIISFDTETTGLRMNFKSQIGEADQLVGLVFSVTPGESFYVPLRHRYIDNVCEEWEIQGVLDTYFREVLETKSILAHNLSFDWKTLWTYGINCNLKEDTLTLYHLSMGTKKEVSGVGLKTLAHEILGRDSLELNDFTDESWGTGELDFRDLPEEEVRLYACADTDNTLELYLWAEKNDIKLKYGLTKDKLYQLEVKFSKVIGYQEFYGHKVAVDRATELNEKVQKELEGVEQSIYEQSGHEFNIASSPQLTKVLYEEMGLPVLEYTQSGNPSASKGTLKKLAKRKEANGELSFPIVGDLLEFRELKTLYNNFLKKLPQHATTDGFMFSSVRQFLETGRVSITNPNYQSYSDTVKKYIVPRQGYYMMDADYSAVEYRVLASMSGQENLIESFKDPDADYHSVQAARMFGVPVENVSHKLRSFAKSVNFGVPYGLSNRGLGETIFGEASPENTKKAAELRKKYFEGQEKVEAFFAEKQQFGEDNLYAETLFGRRRYFDPRVDRIDQIRRAAGNMPIQGSAADLYKTGMVRFFSWIEKNGLLGDILLSGFIHDEVLVEIRNNINPAVVLKYLKAAMRINITGWAPLEIGCGWGRNWYEAKSTELPIYLQEEIISSLNNNGGNHRLSWWDKDGADLDRLYDWELAAIFRHGAERVEGYVKDRKNQGQTVKAAINTIAHDTVKFAQSSEYDRLKEIERQREQETGVNDFHYTDWLAVDPDEVSLGETVLDAVEACCMLKGGEELVETMRGRNLKNPNSDVKPTESEEKQIDERVEEKLQEQEGVFIQISKNLEGVLKSKPVGMDGKESLIFNHLAEALETGQSISLEGKIIFVSEYILSGEKIYKDTSKILTKALERASRIQKGSFQVIVITWNAENGWGINQFNEGVKIKFYTGISTYNSTIEYNTVINEDKIPMAEWSVGLKELI